ncbi:MAG: glucoamylase family protein [Terriglobales bacterium]
MEPPLLARQLTRRELLRHSARAAIAYPALNFTFSLVSCGGGSSSPPPPPPVSDDEFLDQVQRAIFQFFWEQASPATGQVKDRALAAGNDNRTVSSIAATGFGLTALCVGHRRGYGDAAQIKSRVATTLDFLLNQLPNQNGFFYHFIDMNTGARVWNSEVSSIDTSILLCGVLTCRQYFQDAQIQSLATQIYNRVNWPWMLNGAAAFSMGWTPENGFIATRWDTYSELLMLYLLAIGATTNPVPASSWDAFTRPTFTYQGLTYITNLNAPLFIHQFSHAWFDFRNKRDRYTNYFNNSVTATQAHKLFCLSLQSQFADYQSNLWGITSSDSANGYTVWGGPPAIGPIDGTIIPCAVGGSLPFASSDCMAVLRNIRSKYPKAWQRYGFVDAFNPLTGWYDPDVIGIDAGITMLMAENQRSNFVWNTFMTNPEVQKALTLVQLQ